MANMLSSSASVPLHPARPDLVVLFIFALAFSICSRLAGAFSDGFLEADASVHYMYARHAFSQPHFFIDIWGRPLKTALLSLPAHFGGRSGAQCMSLALALASAWLCALIAKKLTLPRWPLAGLFLLAQPLIFLHSFSELTELPFVFVLSLAMYLAVCHRWLACSLLIGLLPLGRPEGFGFVLLALVAFIWWKKPLPAFSCLLGLITWSILGWELYGRSPASGPHLWLITYWPYAATSVYTPGPLWHFAALFPALTGPGLFPPIALGLALAALAWPLLLVFQFKKPLSITSPPSNPSSPQQSSSIPALRSPPPAFLWLGFFSALALLITLIHSLLYATGKMASNGELRYLMVIAPMLALCGLSGANWLALRLRLRHLGLTLALLAALPALLNFRLPLGPITLGYPVLPLKLTQDWLEARQLINHLQSTGTLTANTRLMAAHPGLYYTLDLSRFGPAAVDWHLNQLHAPLPNTLLIWDKLYGTHNADTSRVIRLDQINPQLWQPVPLPEHLSPNWSVFISTPPIPPHPPAAPQR